MLYITITLLGNYNINAMLLLEYNQLRSDTHKKLHALEFEKLYYKFPAVIHTGMSKIITAMSTHIHTRAQFRNDVQYIIRN